ncbi:RteC domain-containing protein [Lacibacter sediminis]|uniref:RteC domain-containing protein n=1 Tax=Lacibacter sediminis TaxID=2760713 RepID=A0A7G5XKX5_9BACT|nr:RteC domain-containing protein [Lacibacter sediminis]QNA46128.1 RteC domain-containing protein [Lacibacter sediminis]
MKQKTTFFQVFEKKRNEIQNIMLEKYRETIEQARDESKLEIHSKELNELYNAHRQQLYKLGKNSRFLIEIDDSLKANKNETFENLFNANILQISKKEGDGVIIDLAQLDAISKAISEIRRLTNEYLTEDKKENVSKQIELQWKGGELELVHLVYSLFHAKLLTNGKNQITHLVEQVAEAFNHKLGKNWQINLSESINDRKADYQPKVIEKIVKAYTDYSNKQIEINEKKDA